MTEPLVSVNIPTHNSQPLSNACLRAVKEQTYKNREVIVIDRHSTDRTAELAKTFGASVIETSHDLLGARYEGIRASKGEYVLLLDPELMLFPDTIERLVRSMEGCDMMCLEEDSYSTTTLVDKMFVAEKEMISQEPVLNPTEGVMEARFYRKSILEAAFANIDMKNLADASLIDCAIIYYEAFKISNRVDFLPRAMMRAEPSTVKDLWHKNMQRGRAIQSLVNQNIYPELAKRKTQIRKGKPISANSIKSLQLSLLKGIPHSIGMLQEKRTSRGGIDGYFSETWFGEAMIEWILLAVGLVASAAVGFWWWLHSADSEIKRGVERARNRNFHETGGEWTGLPWEDTTKEK